MRAPAAGPLRGLRGGARGGAEVPATRGPIWRSVRCAATAWDPTPPRRSPSWHGPRHCGRRYRSAIGRSTDVTSGHGAPASATMIALAACHGPAAACVAAATRPGRSGGLPGPLRRGRVDVTASGYCGDPDQRRRRPARCPPVRARAVPRCVRAVARTEISVLLGARFPLCLASLDRLSQLSTTRAGARVVSATRTLRARGEGDASASAGGGAHGTHSVSRFLLAHHHRCFLPPP